MPERVPYPVPQIAIYQELFLQCMAQEISCFPCFFLLAPAKLNFSLLEMSRLRLDIVHFKDNIFRRTFLQP